MNQKLRNCTIFLALVILGNIPSVFAQFLQPGCPNANLSSNNFTGWTGYTGSYGNAGASMGIVNGRHTIITAAGIDPNTCGGLQMIPPGHNRSLRLGNSGTGAQAERITYQISVSQANALFIYKYAVVLQNPGHSPNSQPTFQARVLNAAGAQIGGNCGIYTVYGGQPGQNFQNCGGTTWLPWTVVGLNLTPYIGQNVIIEFTTQDCSLSGHYGYGYVVAECMPLIIDVDFCFGSNLVQLTAPFGFQSYSWQPGGSTSQSITVNNPGQNQSYTCTMQSFSNQGNCTVSISAQAIPTTLNANFTYGSACPWSPIQFNSTTVIAPNTVGGVPLPNGGASSWSWNFGDNTSLSGNNPGVHMNPTHIYQNAGTYTVTHITTTQAGCSDTISQIITISPPPLINFTMNDTCVNQTVSFVNQTVDPTPCTYTWNFGNGSPTTSVVNPTYTYPAAGTYNVSLIASNQGGCIDTLTQALTIYPLPPVSAGVDQSVCPGFPVTMSGSGANTYTWNNGGINNVPFTPLSSNTYTVTGIDANGCVNTDNALVTVYPQPIVNAGLDVATCTGTMVTLNGSGAQTYTWNNGISNGVPFSQLVGIQNYIVTGIDVNGCIDTDTAQVNIQNNPTVNFTISNACEGLIATCTNTTIDPLPLTYDWNFGDGSQNSTLTSPTHVFATAGQYTVTLIAQNANACDDTLQQVVTIYPTPTIDAGPDVSVCPNFPITLNATGGFTYIWETGTANGTQYVPTVSAYLSVVVVDTNTCQDIDSLFVTVFPQPIVDGGIDISECIGTSVTLSATGAATYAWDGNVLDGVTFIPAVGNYNFTVTGTDLNGCIDTNIVNVLIFPNPVVIAGNDQIICSGANLTLSGGGAVSYVWNNNVVNGVSFIPAASSSYEVIGTDANGCIDNDSITVAIEPITNVSFIAPVTEGCEPLQVTLNNTSTSTPGVSCIWDFGDGQTGSDCSNINHTYNTPGCYDVQLTVTTALGCIWTSTINDYICVFPNPTAVFTPSPNTLNDITTTAYMNNGSSGADTYFWDFGDGSAPSTEESPSHSFPGFPPTNYTIELTATTVHGCIDTMTQIVVVEESLIYYIPNTFTPDSDEHNQTWLPIFSSGVDPFNYSLYLYNRWGELVWESHNPNVGWDGTYGMSGNHCQDGIYTYKISYKTPIRDDRFEITGHLNLMR